VLALEDFILALCQEHGCALNHDDGNGTFYIERQAVDRRVYIDREREELISLIRTRNILRQLELDEALAEAFLGIE
jgi:hypothetical protein